VTEKEKGQDRKEEGVEAEKEVGEWRRKEEWRNEAGQENAIRSEREKGNKEPLLTVGSL